jgi:CoA-transferase family III/Hydantoinase B/oxoprolinase
MQLRGLGGQMSNPLPLDDVQVVELGQLLAGPFCGQLLGDFGAEVIKVEDPGHGDPMRQWGRERPYGKSLWWPVVARNKKSVTADLRTPRGQDLVRRLLEKADVLVENFRPGTLERWGLGPEQLWEQNPGLVITRVSGFGQTGPYATRAGFGSIGEAMGGIRYVTGDPDRPPARTGVSLGDSLAATFACLGTLVALHQRGRTGRGDLFGGLLGQTNPDLLNVAGFSSSPHFMYSGTYGEGERKGEWFQLYSIGFGGIPGRPLGDGPDGHSLWPSFVNIPCEYLESYYPLRIERWETVADTGGAGLHRGGNGVDVAYRFLEAGTVAIHDDRWLTYPWGVNGGEPGARGRKWIERADGSREVLGSKVHDVPVRPGDLLRFVTWGGGGWGDPLRRDPALVALEVRRGLVSVAGARRYGVVCDEAGTVDEAATESLRDSLRADRPDPLPTFNTGPDIETILARALEETGLPAPVPPIAR